MAGTNRDSLYRGERWRLSYGIETAYGEAPHATLPVANTGPTYLAMHNFGVFEDATLADPEFDHTPYWFQNPSARNYTMAYKGKARCSGSIPDIVLLDGKTLALPISNKIFHEDATTYWKHTIEDTIFLPSFRVVATYLDSSVNDGVAGLIRYFVGGKVNRASYHCAEGDILKLSLEDILFKMPYYKDDDYAQGTITPWYNANNVDQSTLAIPTTEPYYFSYGALNIKLAANALTNVPVRSIRNFKLDVNNNLEPKYYLMTNDEKVLYQIYEGRREYRLSMQIDLIDYVPVAISHDLNTDLDKNDFFMELINQGKDTTLKGSGIQMTFTRGTNDLIKFSIPGNDGGYHTYAPNSGANQQGGLIVRASHPIMKDGVVSVGVEMVVPDMQIYVEDAIPGGEGIYNTDSTHYPYGTLSNPFTVHQ